jgi:hypothetical protein
VLKQRQRFQEAAKNLHTGANIKAQLNFASAERHLEFLHHRVSAQNMGAWVRQQNRCT